MAYSYEELDFPRILTLLAEQAVSEEAKTELRALAPSLSEGVCRSRMAATTAARRLLDAQGTPPLGLMSGLEATLSDARRGAMLTAGQLTGIAYFIQSCDKMNAWLKRGAAVLGSFESLATLREELLRCIDEDRVNDNASRALRDLRRKHETLEAALREKLTAVLQSRRQYLADGYFTVRGGRYVVPVQKRYQSLFSGTVVDVSAKGSTVFMEPSSVAKLQGELDECAAAEEAETRRVLYELTAQVYEQDDALRRNRETMCALDVLLAKAKLSAALHAAPVELTTDGTLDLREAYHPLLPRETAVPLDLTLPQGIRGVVITGPNTGGKTVTLKTVGLFCLMAQCGLHVPCAAGSRLPLCDDVLCDVGDAQSIAQNLSTFSGHMTRMIAILQRASRDTLVLLDEPGSGTDPAEGMGIAVAVLAELRRRGCLFLSTTHDPSVKNWAETEENVLTARMTFDAETLRPLYRLELGRSGESCALHIAAMLGLPESILRRARQEAYHEPITPQKQPPVPKSRLTRLPPPKPDLSEKFHLGDSVIVNPDGETGLVFQPVDERGMVGVQVRGEKRLVNHQRVVLRVSASELYPPDYDFSIVFDTVANRKARHQMGRKLDRDAVIVVTEGKKE